ncbi:MAG: MoaD/ThiS family protein [Saprospiraceae bacterium]|nr:MoaD/ThiS family protein [Saprospiraceae bacterium]
MPESIDKTSVQVLAFGIAKDIIGQPQVAIDLSPSPTVGELKAVLLDRFPAFGRLNSMAIAVNSEYARDEDRVDSGDEVVIIPPVSGG